MKDHFLWPLRPGGDFFRSNVALATTYQKFRGKNQSMGVQKSLRFAFIHKFQDRRTLMIC